MKSRKRSDTGQSSHPDTVIEATRYVIDFNAGRIELLNDLLRDLGASSVGILDLIVVRRESIKVVDQLRVLGDIDRNSVHCVLPMRPKHDNGLGLDLCGDVSSDLR